MINGVFLQSFGFFGGGFGNLLSQLEQLGFFSYVLPFLLIFALVFGIGVGVSMFTAITVSRTFLFAIAPKESSPTKKFFFSNGFHR